MRTASGRTWRNMPYKHATTFPASFPKALHMPRVRATSDEQLRLRVEVLALDGLRLRPNNMAIARQCAARLKRAVNVSTVRSILKRFGQDGEDIPRDKPRPGRKSKFPIRGSFLRREMFPVLQRRASQSLAAQG